MFNLIADQYPHMVELFAKLYNTICNTLSDITLYVRTPDVPINMR